MAKRPRAPERIEGQYSGIPWNVMDSFAFSGATNKAKAMLFELMRQHNGRNNGHLHATISWLVTRGWTSKSSAADAVAELEQRGLIVKTRQGGRNAGPSYYALTWHIITNFVGLDIDAKQYRRGAWAECDLFPSDRRPPPAKNCDHRPAWRGSPAPVGGADDGEAAPLGGSKTGTFLENAAPLGGEDVIKPFPRRKRTQPDESTSTGRDGIAVTKSPACTQASATTRGAA